ncbi:MAG: hypothetical protein JW984_16090 [Deltaproteobacteria bacterium]|uniref:Uncharacterized protein n=1 Tax=Candidatus Zymogenus saltonus TaxID=2844893 RepID=A0A9D8KHF1_9DELT|nr:hypothetical protein [Candidatus Zymogenus saltonus]
MVGGFSFNALNESPFYSRAKMIAISIGTLSALGIASSSGERLLLISIPFFSIGRILDGLAIGTSISYFISKYRNRLFSISPPFIIVILHLCSIAFSVHGLYRLAISIPQYKRNMAIVIGICIVMASAKLVSPTASEVFSLTSSYLDSNYSIILFTSMLFLSFPVGLVIGFMRDL